MATINCTLLLCALLLFVYSGSCQFARTSPKVVPNGSTIKAVGSYLEIQHPDGSREISRVATSRATKREDQGWIASVSSSSNYTYFSANWTVPPVPTNKFYQILYYKNTFTDVASTGIIEAVLSYYNYNDSNSGWQVSSWFVPWNGYFITSDPVNVKPGDHVRGEVSLSGNTWNIIEYVNGVNASKLSVEYTTDMYIEFPSKPNYTVATTSDGATQNYLTVLPYDPSKKAGRLFTFTSDGYIRLSANHNLVMDVDGSTAKEGARVLVYAQKSPVSQNQQWVVKDGIIYSKLNQAYSLTVNNASQVVLTEAHPQSPYINYPGAAGQGITGSASYALEVYNLFSCAQYPSSNSLQATNFVLKKGSQTVTPTWTKSITNSKCKVNIASASSSATLTWNSTAIPA